MTSTIEVYDPATAALPAVPHGTPVPEGIVDPAAWLVRMDLPWHDAAYLEAHYAEGKRQAEAVFTRDGGFAFASVRSAHVLGGGVQEFTGRLAHYIERIGQGRRSPCTPGRCRRSSSITRSWRTCCCGRPRRLHRPGERLLRRAARRTMLWPPSSPRRPAGSPYTGPSPRDEEASPFSFDRHYAMSNARAKELGFSFSRTTDWLPGAVTEALTAHTATAAIPATPAT